MLKNTDIVTIFQGCNIEAYPVIAERDATVPFATFTRTSMSRASKDITELHYNCRLMAATYSDSLDLLNIIMDYCDSSNYEYEVAGESYEDNYYINEINIIIYNEYKY